MIKIDKTIWKMNYDRQTNNILWLKLTIFKMNYEWQSDNILSLKLIKYFLKMNYEFQTDNILGLNWQINSRHELWMTNR